MLKFNLLGAKEEIARKNYLNTSYVKVQQYR